MTEKCVRLTGECLVCAVFGSHTAFASVVFGSRLFTCIDLHAPCERVVGVVAVVHLDGRSFELPFAIPQMKLEQMTATTQMHKTQHNESSSPNILKAWRLRILVFCLFSATFTCCVCGRRCRATASNAHVRCTAGIHKPSISHSHLWPRLHFSINIIRNTRRQPLLAQKCPAENLMMECEFTGRNEMSRVVFVVVWSLHSFGIYRNLICPLAGSIDENSNDNTKQRGDDDRMALCHTWRRQHN